MQVEYAMERVNREVPTVGILSKEGVILGAERKERSKLLDKSKFVIWLRDGIEGYVDSTNFWPWFIVHEMDKMYKIDEHMFCAVSGLSADANFLIDEARVTAQRHLYKYHEPVPCE